MLFCLFFFNYAATTEIYTLSLHDALPILYAAGYDPSAMATMFEKLEAKNKKKPGFIARAFATHPAPPDRREAALALDRKSTRLNSSHSQISYAVFCLKKKKK